MFFSRPRAARKNRSTRLALECLEDRSVPATHVWTGGALSNNWTNNNNWNIGAPNSADDVLVFPNNAATKNNDNNFAAGTAFAKIVIQDNGYDLRGNRVKLGAGGISATYSGTSNIRLRLELPAAVPIQVNSGTLVLNDAISGAGGFTKSGVGQLHIRGVNTFTGAVSIQKGLVTINRDGSLGSAAKGTTVGNGGELFVQTVTGLPGPSSEPLVMQTGGKLIAFNVIDFKAPIVFTGAALFQNSAISAVVNTSISGKLSGAGGFTFSGSKPVVFTGGQSNTNTGYMVVQGGKLELNRTPGATSIRGQLVINNGSVKLRSADQIANTSVVTVNKLGLLDLNGRKDTVGGLRLTSGRVITGTLGELGLNGNVTATSDSATQARIEGKLFLGVLARTFQVDNGPASSDLVVTARISGAGGVTKTGAGAAWFTAANTYQGSTFINAGALKIDGFQPLSSVTVRSGASLYGKGTVGSLTTTATLRVIGDLTLESGAILHANLNGTLAGLQHDQIIVNGGPGKGKVSVSGARLDAQVGSSSRVGFKMRIVDNDLIDNVAGTFGGLAQGATFTAVPGVKLSIDYNSGLSGNDITLTHKAT